MKNSMIFMALSMLTFGLEAQNVKNSDLPEAVRTNFIKLYPSASDIKWEKEGAGFEVNFELGETETSVVFDDLGNVLETEVEITIADVPVNVKTYMDLNYKNYKIREATKITDSNGSVSYELEIKDKDILFDASGNFIKMELDGEDDGKD